MIILEGPDNSGKSTLGATLSERLGVELHHSGGPVKVGTVEERVGWMREGKPPPHKLWDRFPVISDVVFGHTLRDETPIGHFYVRRLIMYSPLIIYCRPPLDVMMQMENHQVKDNHIDTPEHVAAVRLNQRAIIAAYDTYMKVIAAALADGRVWSYSYVTDDLGFIQLACENHLRQWEARYPT